MPTRQLVSIDDEAPAPAPAPVAAAAVAAAAADTVVAPADAVSLAPPQQSSAANTSNTSANTSANTTSTGTCTEAKTVTPKKDGDDDESSGKKAKKKGGRPKKGGKELPPNQRTLGSFFGASAAPAGGGGGAGGAKKSKPRPKPKPKPSRSKDAVATATATATATSGSKPNDAGAEKAAPPSSKADTTTKAKKKSTAGTASKTATSDKIKAIVLGSAHKKAAAGASAALASSVAPAKLLGTSRNSNSTAAGSAGSACANKGGQSTSNNAKSSISAISTAALIGIPNGAIPSQKQIQMQEEREEEEERARARAREEQEQEEERLLLEQVESNNKEEGDQGKVEEAESESSVNPSAASSFVSPTPPTGKNKTAGTDKNKQQQQQKKAKKRATLISVTSTNATAPGSEETHPEAKAKAKANEEQPIVMEVDDDEQKDGDDDDEDDDVIMVMDDDDDDEEENARDLTGTAAKGSAVEGTKVLDVTLGKDSDRGEEDEEDASSAAATTKADGAQDVSKKLNFTTPNKKEGTGGTAASVAPVFGGLDAFTVPISSIKASKKAKAAAAAREAANVEGESYVSKRIAKEFDDGKIYRGTVTKYTAETGNDGGLWHIVYEDDDEEDLNPGELQAALKLFESEEAKTVKAAAPVPAETSVATPPSAAPSPTAAAMVATAKSTAAATPTENELPDEFKEVLAKHEALRKRYRKRAEDLVQRSTELSEEDFERTVQPKDGADEETASSPEDGAFPESLLSELAVLIQGSPLPLSTLTNNAVTELFKRTEGRNLTADVVSAKIKILASRKQYLTPLTPPESGVQVDKFEDTQINLMWRWELTTIELLPSTLVKTAKTVVSERRKLQNFFKAVVKLLSSLDKADLLFLNAKSLKIKRESALAKISADEDKVLKFEREEEKQRLIREAKAQKEKAKLEAKAQKDQAKKAATEKKELEKKVAAEKKEQGKKAAAAKRKEESERKKTEAAKAKEEAKRKKEEEKAAKKRKAEAKVEKQRACMASFFGASSPPRSKTKSSPKKSPSSGGAVSSAFESDAFWKSLGTADSLSSRPAPFKKLSKHARESRKRKTKEVAVTVFATVMPDNPFDQQPYDEERILKVPNKYKFLAFHEDYRPPYHGTWSKPRSTIVTGRNPLGRDTTFLDYDVDSEAEWEEGDDEEGEDCEIDGPDDDEEDKIDGEEGDTRMYNYDDGWLAQDDEYDVEDNEEDNDEDTMAMRKRKAAEVADASKKQGLTLARVCVVAPVYGGIPLVEAGSDVLGCPELVAEHVDGADVKIGKDLLASHEAFDFMPCSENCLDLFPAPKSKKAKKTSEKDGSHSPPSKTQASKEMSQDDLRAFAKFVHNSTLGSKDKVIEELQTALPDITSSRAQATRKLDSIAEKRRLKYGGGVVWEVKSSVLESLNLEASDLNPAPVEKEPEKKAAKSPKRKKGDKKEKDPNAPKRASSSYIFYSNANRQKLKEANKEASNAELLKLLGESWKALSGEEKQPYEDMAAKDKVRYQTEMAAYKPDSADEPAEKKAKTIDIQEVWRKMNFCEVKSVDLVKSSRILVNHKGSLFKATIHKSRAKGESLDFQVQYFGNKATTLHWKPFSDVRALLDERDEPIVVDVPPVAVAAAAATSSAEASLKVAESVVTTVSSNSAHESSKESITEPPVGTKGADTDAKQSAADSVVITGADDTKDADVIASEKKPVESTTKAGKKRAAPAPVSAGSKNLLASFLKRAKKK